MIALNSMFFMRENICDFIAGTIQLDWLESELSQNQNGDRKIVLTMHVPPGGTYTGHEEHQFWHSNFTSRFL